MSFFRPRLVIIRLSVSVVHPASDFSGVEKNGLPYIAFHTNTRHRESSKSDLQFRGVVARKSFFQFSLTKVGIRYYN
jgi:hypothetical protein